MGSPLDQPSSGGWEAEGQRIAAALDGISSALVIGVEPVEAAEVALGIARVQARRRRVAVADVVGELPPIEAQLPAGVAHGIVDAFLYGVSLNKVAQPIDPARNLLILPSGAAPLDHEVLLQSPRWPRLAGGFRDAGALLLVLAPELAAALGSLAPMLDGVVLVGDAVAPPGARVIARASLAAPEPIVEPAREPVAAAETTFAAAPASEPGAAPAPAPERVAEPAPPPAPARPTPRIGSRLLTPASVARSVRKPTPIEPAATIPATPERPAAPRERAEREASAPVAEPTESLHEEFITGADIKTPDVLHTVAPAGGRPLPFWIGIGVAALVVVALVTWATRRLLPPPPAPAPAADTTSAPPAASRIDTAAAVTAAKVGDGIVNPADSASAVHWAVAMVDYGSESGANRRFDRELDRGVPAVTWIPMAPSDTARRVYRVVSGAYADRATADSLLRALRARHILGRGAGHLIDAPFALLVQRGVARDDVSIFLHGRQLAGLPVYALAQPDGRANVYAGAFESAAAARLLLPKFRANGEQPRVAYRTGRPF